MEAFASSGGRTIRLKVVLGLLALLALVWLGGALVWGGSLLYPALNVLALMVAAFCVTRPTAGWQIAGRGLMAGQLLTPVLHGASVSVAVVILMSGLAMVLGLLGRHGLAEDGGPFAPVKLRGLLIATIVACCVFAYSYAAALSQNLLLAVINPEAFAHSMARPGALAFNLTRLALALGFVAAAVALYRLKVIALALPVVLAVRAFYAAFTVQVPVFHSASGTPPPPALVEQAMARQMWDAMAWGGMWLLLLVVFGVALWWARRRGNDRVS